ncbi:MAG: hypothetical protein Q9227_004616 [Pyrenula ochraceoflavens]
MDFYPDDIGGFAGFMGRPPVGMSTRRFDEYFRCYPIVMLQGSFRKDADNGGKIFLPPSALDKLSKLHVTYPMLFELINGREETKSHAGVLEFIAEEGKVYLPQWLMQTLKLEVGDLLQVKSTDLPPGSFVKLQPQSPTFLDITDPRAVLENAFRNFACLTEGDIFTFSYNDQEYSIAVLETKPKNDSHAVVTMETDLEVDFATPVGYEEPKRTSGTSTPRSGASGVPGLPHNVPMHYQGTMAQSINYASIAPTSNTAAAGAKAVSSNFLHGGQKLSSKKGSKNPTPRASTPVAGTSINDKPPTPKRNMNGPQPLRLPPGKLFFGYEIKPVRKRNEAGEVIPDEETRPKFQGQGQTLRPKKRDLASSGGGSSDAEAKPKESEKKGPTGTGSTGRTLR